MLTRIVIVLLCVLGAQSGCQSTDPWKGAIYISDGTATLTLLVRVTDARSGQPVQGATVTAVRAGRGTTLLSSYSTAMPPPKNADRRGRAMLLADFRSAGDPSGYSVFVAESFLRVQAPGFDSSDVRISSLGRLDFTPKTKKSRVTIPVALEHE